ncbi:MAG: hypothetical protein R2810_10840 [Flavobacteriales bacterium]
MTQPVKEGLKAIKVRLDHRTVVTLASMKAFKFWKRALSQGRDHRLNHGCVLQREQFLPVSLEEAWEFFSTPRNLARITAGGHGLPDARTFR